MSPLNQISHTLGSLVSSGQSFCRDTKNLVYLGGREVKRVLGRELSPQRSRIMAAAARILSCVTTQLARLATRAAATARSFTASIFPGHQVNDIANRVGRVCNSMEPGSPNAIDPEEEEEEAEIDEAGYEAEDDLESVADDDDLAGREPDEAGGERHGEEAFPASSNEKNVDDDVDDSADDADDDDLAGREPDEAGGERHGEEAFPVSSNEKNVDDDVDDSDVEDSTDDPTGWVTADEYHSDSEAPESPIGRPGGGESAGAIESPRAQEKPSLGGDAEADGPSLEALYVDVKNKISPEDPDPAMLVFAILQGVPLKSYSLEKDQSKDNTWNLRIDSHKETLEGTYSQAKFKIIGSQLNISITYNEKGHFEIDCNKQIIITLPFSAIAGVIGEGRIPSWVPEINVIEVPFEKGVVKDGVVTPIFKEKGYWEKIRDPFGTAKEWFISAVSKAQPCSFHMAVDLWSKVQWND
ncbi:MAG: hypothetical protein WB791_00840 [Waddliaceae bacterium]